MVTSFKWSIDDWHELVESGVLEGKSVELLEGEIINVSPEGIEHSHTNRTVADYLKELLAGIAYVSEAHPITLDNSPHSSRQGGIIRASEPEPDVAVVALPKDTYKKRHPHPQDIYLLIEIAKKTLKFDLEQKSKIYARNRIPEYWVIDLINKELIVHAQPQADFYTQIAKYNSGNIVTQAFPNIPIKISQLLLF
jgi:Uma2 family endonuclease